MQRPAPPITERTGQYWKSGADGTLRIARCQDCGWYLHPPRPVCPKCRGRNLAFSPVSGRGKVYSWTINRYAWFENLPPPYIIAEVELEEQRGLMLTTSIVDCALDAVQVDMPVGVRFEQSEDAWIPVFAPC